MKTFVKTAFDAIPFRQLINQKAVNDLHGVVSVCPFTHGSTLRLYGLAASLYWNQVVRLFKIEEFYPECISIQHNVFKLYLLVNHRAIVVKVL